MHSVRHLPPFCLRSALGRARSLFFFVTGSVLRCTGVGRATASLLAPLGLLIHAGEFADAGWRRCHGTRAAGCCEGSHNPGNATTSHGTAWCRGTFLPYAAPLHDHAFPRHGRVRRCRRPGAVRGLLRGALAGLALPGRFVVIIITRFLAILFFFCMIPPPPPMLNTPCFTRRSC